MTIRPRPPAWPALCLEAQRGPPGGGSSPAWRRPRGAPRFSLSVVSAARRGRRAGARVVAGGPARLVAGTAWQLRSPERCAGAILPCAGQPRSGYNPRHGAHRIPVPRSSPALGGARPARGGTHRRRASRGRGSSPEDLQAVPGPVPRRSRARGVHPERSATGHLLRAAAELLSQARTTRLPAESQDVLPAAVPHDGPRAVLRLGGLHDADHCAEQQLVLDDDHGAAREHQPDDDYDDAGPAAVHLRCRLPELPVLQCRRPLRRGGRRQHDAVLLHAEHAATGVRAEEPRCVPGRGDVPAARTAARRDVLLVPVLRPVGQHHRGAGAVGHRAATLHAIERLHAAVGRVRRRSRSAAGRRSALAACRP